MTMSLKDVRGLGVSTQNAKALARYEEAAVMTHSYFGNPLAAADEALAEQPDFAMAHALKAALAVMSTEQGAMPMLSEAVDAIDALGNAAAPRERGHAAAARAWLDGDFHRSAKLYGDIIVEYPHDLLA